MSGPGAGSLETIQTELVPPGMFFHLAHCPRRAPRGCTRSIRAGRHVRPLTGPRVHIGRKATMIRTVVLFLCSLSSLLASSAEAVPISFGASFRTVGDVTGHAISSGGIAVPAGPLLLTLPPDPLSQFNRVFSDGIFSGIPGTFDEQGSLSLVLQTPGSLGGVVQNGAVLGGYRFIRFDGENSAAQYVLCASPNHCVSEFGFGATSPPLSLSPTPPLFDWPVAVPILYDSTLSCPFGPPVCVLQDADSSHLVLPSVPGGVLVATIDFSATPICPLGVPVCVAQDEVNFTLDALNPVPEPATLLLFSTTAAGLGFARWRDRRSKRRAQADVAGSRKGGTP